MSENLTRRAALGVLGVSSMALLAACGSKATSEASASASGSESASAAASESATASPSASASASASASPSASASATATSSPLPNDNKDYSGVAKLEKMEEHGEYQPGIAEHPPQNVPSPIVPEAMHQNSVAGFAAALAYFGAAFEYLLRTGDMHYMNEVSTDQETLAAMKKYADSTKAGIDEKKTWYVNPTATLTIGTKQPVLAQGAYNWTVTLNVDLGEKLFKDGKEQTVAADKRHVKMFGEAVGRYLNNKWDLHMDIN